jgi:hypothetical protein
LVRFPLGAEKAQQWRNFSRILAMHMLNRTQIEDVERELAVPLQQTFFIINSYLQGLDFIVRDTARDPACHKNHLLFYLAQDLLQSAVSITSLAMEGLHSVAKRELRFVLETSVKLCFVEQMGSELTVAEKLETFNKELSSPCISIKNNLNLRMLPDSLQELFAEEVGRIYGLTSKYVHLTPTQIQERISAVSAGRTAGRESAQDITQLNTLVSRSLAASLVLIYHSVPDWVAGDWLVEEDGTSAKWYFLRSRFVSAMDSFFDYKAERQSLLLEIIAARRELVEF